MGSRQYVGIDPSMSTGVVIMEHDEVIFAQEIVLKNGMKSTLTEILEYGRKVAGLVLPYSVVAIEGFAFSARGSAVSFQYAIGHAIRFALIDAGIPYLEPTPSALKLFVAGKGKGNCKKEIVIKEVYKRWGYEHDSNNVIDAYALCKYAIAKEE
jgi:crossover junction endodeoxyribonuclease RuvC